MATGTVGQIALLCALVLTIYGVALAILGSVRRLPALIVSSRNVTFGVAAIVTVASGVLVYAFVTNDFSLAYVTQTSNRTAPLAVALSGFWGGQAGSLLFWSWGLSLFTAIAAAREFHRHRALMPGVIGTLLVVQVFFLGVLAFGSNPFEMLPTPAADGKGLNPLLWDDGMRIHPPLLLTGYMSFTVPFAFAIAALVTGRLGREWLAPVRNWMMIAWAIQALGLLAGAWWAYHVLGWGGYWGWDPVENVALLPWLISTAFLHSVMVQERRGMLKVWNLSLVIACFCLAIFGTFVVRSGVLSSVHSFAQSTVGPYFFAFIGVVLIASLVLLFYRLPLLGSEGQFESLVSREAAFLLNNLLLVGIATATFWGTIFPLVSEVVRGAKLSVGAPFYQQVTGPPLLALLVLMGIGPLLAWRRATAASLWRNVRWPLAAAAVVTSVLFVAGIRQGLVLLALAAAVFTLGTITLEYWRGVRARRRSTGEPYPKAVFTLVDRARRRYGGYIVHLGMVFIAFGVIGSSFYQVEQVGTLNRGESLTVGRYTFANLGLFQAQEPGVARIFARLAVREGNTDLTELRPARNIHTGWESQPVTQVALQTTGPWLDDLYVILSSWNDDGSAATFRILINPLVGLIWVGAAIFLVGTLTCVWPIGVRRPVLAAPVPLAPPEGVRIGA